MSVQQPGRGLRQPRATIRARPRSADGSGLDRRTPHHAHPLRIGQKARAECLQLFAATLRLQETAQDRIRSIGKPAVKPTVEVQEEKLDE